jgi:hypothetical protein
MPEYDPTQPPAQATPDLTPETPTKEPAFDTWPDNPVLPAQYGGPPPSREYETAGGPSQRARPARAVPPPPDAPAPMTPTDPPPGTKPN